jgi:hypothetical protein
LGPNMEIHGKEYNELAMMNTQTDVPPYMKP